MDTRSEVRDYRPGLVALAAEVVSAMGDPFHIPVTKIAACFRTSRQTVYQLREEVRHALDGAFQRRKPGPRPPGPQEEGGLQELRRQHALATLRIEVLTYERDHGVVFADCRRKHLPPQARSFLVAVFRRYREAALTEAAIAETIAVPLTSLRRWDAEADAEGRFPDKPDGRGQHRKPGLALVREVIGAYGALREPIALCDFVNEFNAGRAPQVPTRTIAKILWAYVKRRARRRERYKLPPEPFRVYFPGAQLSLDGKELVIGVGEEKIRVTCQGSIDIATTLIVGDAIGRQETAEGTRVTIRAAREVAPFLAVLFDNKAANVAGADACAGMEVGPIFTFYYRPQTNGHLEGGLWGRFVKAVGPIQIDTSSPQAIGESVARTIWRVYAYFSNHIPRKRLGGKSALAYFRAYLPRPEEVERAKRELLETKRRSDRAHRRVPDISAEKRILIETVCRHWGFDASKQLRYLAPFDGDLIAEADSILAAYSQRESGSEGKRTPQYFCGIVRTLQERRDLERQNAHAFARESELLRARMDRKAREIQQEEEAERELLKTRPELVVREYLAMGLPTQLRFVQPWSRVERALEALKKLGEAGRRRFAEILAWLELLPGELEGRARVVARLKEAFDGI